MWAYNNAVHGMIFLHGILSLDSLLDDCFEIKDINFDKWN